jgi:hypothetical protein
VNAWPCQWFTATVKIFAAAGIAANREGWLFRKYRCCDYRLIIDIQDSIFHIPVARIGNRRAIYRRRWRAEGAYGIFTWNPAT